MKEEMKDISARTPRDEPLAETWRVVFASIDAAETYLAERGFSVGRRQGPSERGILLGDFDIQKWRNLRPSDRAALHGVLTRSGDKGWAAVTIYGAAPAEAHAAIRSREPMQSGEANPPPQGSAP